MTEPLIDKVETVQVFGAGDAGGDTVFVAVHGTGQTGWYGPVSHAIGREVEALAHTAIGTPLFDHAGLRPQLRTAAPGSSDWAVGAVDCAAWDLHGRLADKPVAVLLAPAGQTEARPVPAYASWLRLDLSSTLNHGLIPQFLDSGWAFTKWGMRRRPGPSTSAEAEALHRALAAAAAVIDGPFAIDAVGTWAPSLATAFASTFDLPTLMWLEDPLPEHSLHDYRMLAATTVPLGLGERLQPHEDPAQLLNLVRPAALTLDVVGCGGLTRAVELTALAQQAGVPVYPHGRSLVPGIHLAAAFPKAVPAAEYRLQWEPRRQLHYTTPWTPTNGHLPAPEAPGLGTEPRRIR